MAKFVTSCRAALAIVLASAGVVILSSGSLAQSNQSPQALKKYCDGAKGKFVQEKNSPTYSCVEVNNDKFTSCTSEKCTVGTLETLKNPCEFVKQACDDGGGNFGDDKSRKSCYCMRTDTNKFTTCSASGCTVKPLRGACDVLRKSCPGNFGEDTSKQSCYCIQPDKDKFTSCSPTACTISPIREAPRKTNAPAPPKADPKSESTKALEEKLAKISNETDCKKNGGEIVKDPLGKRKCVPPKKK